MSHSFLSSLTPYRHGIYTLDAGYDRAQLASIHLMVENGRVAVIDTGTNDSLPYLRLALAQLGLSLEQVDWILLTHVHLDHAGGAGLFMQHCPNAKLVVHPRGTRHMADPSKLMAATLAVYGEEATRRLYGELVPIPMERILETQDGMSIDHAGREILIYDTPGHAKHHVSFWDARAKAVFTGDTFGISYREMDEFKDENSLPHQFIFTTTTPVHFDPPALTQSIDRLMSFSPEVAYLTHFGELRKLPEKTEILKKQIHALSEISLKHKGAGEERYNLIKKDITSYLLEEAQAFGSTLPTEEIKALWEGDLDLDAQGLVVWLDNQ